MESWDPFATSIAGNNMWISIALATTLILCVLALAIGSAMVYGPLLLAVARLKIKGNMPPLPPGSLGLPYWGESLNYINSWAHKINPDVWYDMRRTTHGKIFKSHILGNPTVVLLGPHANRFILINENKLFRNSWPKSIRVLIGEHALVSSQGDHHKRMRTIIRSVLGQETLKNCVARFERIVIRHLDTCLQSGQIMRAHCEMKDMALTVAADYLMGLKPGEALDIFRRHFQVYSAGLLSHPLNLPWTVFGKAKRARTLIIAQICAQIKLRQTFTAPNCGKAEEEDNFLDAILFSRKTGNNLSFSDEEIADNFVGLLIGGQDTTASALSTILSHLSCTPTSLERLRKECEKVRKMKRAEEALTWNEIKSLSYLRNVISEGLRLVAPVTGGFKKTKVDVVYRGYTIPKGWKVHFSMRQTNNKEEYFPNPERFDPDRFNNRHEPFSFIPFGQGNRICPGMDFAKLVMEVFLYHFIFRFDWKLMEPDEPINMQSLVAFPVHGLPLILKPVSSSSERT